MCKNCCVSNPPLGVPWLVVITNSNLCHHWDLQTLKHMPGPWHAISWRERGREREREGGREGGQENHVFLETVNILVLSLQHFHTQFACILPLGLMIMQAVFHSLYGKAISLCRVSHLFQPHTSQTKIILYKG